MNTVRIIFGIVLSAALMLATLPAVAQSADIVAGKKRAAVCFSCHGDSGVAAMRGVPHLAGQDRAYLEKALHAYREAITRQDPTMVSMAKPLSDRDIVNIAAYFSYQQKDCAGNTVADAVLMEQRLQPAGCVTVDQLVQAQATDAAAKPAGGEAIYAAHCAACHATGAAGAPRVGDLAAWKPRIAKGKDTLLKHAVDGLNAMPPRGGCASCNDESIGAAIDHILNQSK